MTSSETPRKRRELQRAKLRAAFLLILAAALALYATFGPPTQFSGALRAFSEAALVGGLADWFAVHALFHRIRTGLPFITNHTAVIPRNKDRIADNLAAFVDERFLQPESLVALIRRHDPAALVGEWLRDTRNLDRLGRFLLDAFVGALAFVEEDRVRKVLRDALAAALRQVDLSQSAAAVLRGLTAEQRHQELLERGIEHVAHYLGQPATRSFVAARIVEWLKSEHPIKEKALPSEWIGDKGAVLLADAVSHLLERIREEPAHELRELFDTQVRDWIVRLESDPALAARGEEIKSWLLDDPALANYAAGLWQAMRAWLEQDLRREDSVLHARIVASGQWLGERLAADEGLRATLDAHLERAARKLAPDFAGFLTGHIRDTVRNWDAREMSAQIELNVGRDLQAIRINGTVVGGAIGLVLYAVSQAGTWWHALVH